MRDNKTFGIGGKGYYIALVLCAAAIGIAGYVYQNNQKKVEQVSLIEQETVEMQARETVPAAVTEPATTGTPNETTRDWRVHNGVDYGAEAGAPVLAAAEGTVTEVKEDDLLGVTVVLRHAGGYETTYAGLAQMPELTVGQRVTLGQKIGEVGTTALAETALGPHIHFSVTYQDMPMDPEDFLSLG